MNRKTTLASCLSRPTPTMIGRGFTLVELIVVVTILAILATIGFVSYSSYLTGVRDTNRLAQLVSLHDGLELYRTKKDLPLPDETIDIKANGELIAYQGYIGNNVLETIDFTKGGKDPKDNQYFSYYLTKDRKYFQLLALLEEKENLQAQNHNISSSIRPIALYTGENVVHAADYTNRVATVYGKKLGILTDDENTPIQELGIPSLDVVIDDTTIYIAHLTDTATMTGSTAGISNLAYLENTGKSGGIASSCNTLIERKPSLKGKNYPTHQDYISAASSLDHFKSRILNGNTDLGNGARDSSTGLWIGNGTTSTCSCGYQGVSSGVGGSNQGTRVCSTWVR